MLCDALYIHVPFCERKCPYCDFYSVVADDAEMDAYVNAVLRSFEQTPFVLDRLDTVYFGGGTPSVLGGKRLGAILEAAGRRFGIAPDAEITAECNPHSALKETLRDMRAAGFNRVSLGMQSAADTQLRALGRMHTVQDVKNAVQMAQKCGFAHLSLDLMLATPGQTPEDVDRGAGLCAELGAEHVSAYLLKIEDGTPFARGQVGNRCPDEDGQAALYCRAVDSLAKHGYQQYEISNFARNGHIARHNLKYWNCSEYLGIGPSAHSFVNGRRRFFPRNINEFLSAANPFTLLCDDGEGGSPEEYLMLRLRLNEGVHWNDLSARYPNYPVRDLRVRTEPMRKLGLLTLDEYGLRLTLDGFLLSNAVLAELL